MKSNFDKLYKLIMEQGYQFRDDNNSRVNSGSQMGKAAYSLEMIGSGNTELYGKVNGELVMNPITGEPVKWQILAAYGRAFDFLTGAKIPKDSSCFYLQLAKFGKPNMYVKLETYQNAYESGDEEMIAKLQEIGLDGGFFIRY
jgi:hypothetical protein